MMKKIMSVLLVLVLTLALFAGCGGSSGEGKKNTKVALLLSGPINDGGFNTDAYDAVMKYKENYGWDVAYTENVAQADIESTMREYVKNGYNFVVGNGFEFGDPMITLAEEYPDVYFFDIIGAVENGKNLGSGTFVFGELGYLCGLLSARVTQSNKVGFVGAMEIPTVATEVKAMELTLVENNHDAEFSIVYTGSWTDVAKAKEAALSMINAGVDVIIGNGDACDVGAIQACEESDGKAKYIGFASDKNSLSPEVVITSGVQSTPRLLENVGKAYAEGKPVVEVQTYDVASGVCYMGTWAENIDPEIKDEVQAAEASIKDGSLKLDLSRFAPQ